jgi:hypothetical protein
MKGDLELFVFLGVILAVMFSNIAYAVLRW